jgi:hypothetical protein
MLRTEVSINIRTLVGQIPESHSDVAILDKENGGLVFQNHVNIKLLQDKNTTQSV